MVDPQDGVSGKSRSKREEKMVHPVPICHGECANIRAKRKGNRMQIKTILNRVQKFKSFVYGDVRLLHKAKTPTLEIDKRPRANTRPVCSECGVNRPGYDTLDPRRFPYVPMWGYQVFFVYSPRLSRCKIWRFSRCSMTVACVLSKRRICKSVTLTDNAS